MVKTFYSHTVYNCIDLVQARQLKLVKYLLTARLLNSVSASIKTLFTPCTSLHQLAPVNRWTSRRSQNNKLCIYRYNMKRGVTACRKRSTCCPCGLHTQRFSFRPLPLSSLNAGLVVDVETGPHGVKFKARVSKNSMVRRVHATGPSRVGFYYGFNKP